MKSNFIRSYVLGTLIFLLIFALGTVQVAPAAAQGQGPDKIQVGHDYKHDVSPPLRDVKPVVVPPRHEHEANVNPHINSGHQDQPDPVVQSSTFAAALPSPILNFNGIAYPGVACNCAPPDTNGEVGLTQYVQIVNEGYQVFNKSTGASVFGPVSISTLWSGFGGVCETAGSGDPVVLYDQLADRWIVSQFAGSSVPTDECIAVSTSSDATGSFNRYAFHLGTSFFDYPKIGVWPDAYYMAMDVYNSAGTLRLGPQPFAFDRAAMLAGSAATFITTGITGGALEDLYMPSDLDGKILPPAGAPNSFVEWPGSGAYKIYHFHADFGTPSNSTFSLFASPAAAGFTVLCATTRNCVPQSGTTSRLDAIGDRFMFRLAYRNFGDHEAVVTNYTVSSGGVAGIRWVELRNVSNGPATVFQESTYQPDTTWRWMGSAAMDGTGNLAVGFSASSSSIVPGLRYAGRLAGDPLNTLAQGEAVLFAGQGSQTGTGNRWGDYSDLTVDPVDDCTFWYTSEYYPSGVTQFNWRTRIGSFQLPGCGGGGPTTGTLQGTVRDAATSAAISAATVTIVGGASTSTDASGFYQFTNVAPGTYMVTAAKTGYNTGTNSGVSVTAGNTTTSDFALTAATTTSTSFLAPSAQAAQTSSAGDNNGYQTNPANAFVDDSLFAVDTNSGTNSNTSCTSNGKDKHHFYNYNFSIPGTAVINGIEVRLDARADATSGAPKICVQISWNGGTTWTTAKQTPTLSTTETTYTLGSPTDTWGRTWASGNFSNANFRIRVIDVASSTARDFSLDYLAVNVTYQP